MIFPYRKVPVGELVLHVYGVDKAAHDPFYQGMAQAFYVEKNGVPTARAELTADERAAVAALLTEQFPEHARL